LATTDGRQWHYRAWRFGFVPAGDYVLRASVRGLASSFSFVVRTGAEPALRDHYLRLKAQRTRDYASFRRLQLERLERDPKRVDALYGLIDRALVEGSLAETQSYFDRVIAAAEAYGNTVAAQADKANARERQKNSARLDLNAIPEQSSAISRHGEELRR
jgi:hypothetical protein